MVFNELLTKYRNAARDNVHLGNTFERVTKRWLQTDPLYRDKFDEIWLWKDFPGRQSISQKDIGIDLVAYNQTTNEYWAIQCKCYYENNQINKKDVDTFLSTAGLPFVIDGKKQRFAQRLFVATTNKWSEHAEKILQKSEPKITKISLTTLEDSKVDWKAIDEGTSVSRKSLQKKSLRGYQQTALDKTIAHFQTNDRGRLIMACGTGKTYTALKIAETLTANNGFVLVLVPSIALVGQLMKEWYTDSQLPIKGVAVCSDPTASRIKDEELQSSLADLPIDATTDASKIIQELHAKKTNKGLQVIFSTYHSIDVISEIQKNFQKNNPEYSEFDLIICDEAHRTTGSKRVGGKETHWVKVHNNDFLAAKKRLYMTATPRLYAENVKKLATNKNVVLWSMDDISHYGEEIDRVSFGDGVQRNDLVDYKVIILTLSEQEIPKKVLQHMKNFYQDKKTGKYETDDLIKLAGVYNALSKKIMYGVDKNTNKVNEGIAGDPLPMQRAVAFCSAIKSSKQTTANIDELSKQFAEQGLLKEAGLQWIDAEHMDGTMRTSEREEKLSWLKRDNYKANETRIITNVRCLTEGVDVPSLDAVIFLADKSSHIDIVQAVGRVMRKSPGKKYGYIVVPVVIDSKADAKKAMDKSERWKTVWAVLNALRAHDDRLDSVIQKLSINNSWPSNVLVSQRQQKYLLNSEDLHHTIGSAELTQFKSLQKVVYGKIVEKVGDRRYWEEWAKDVGEMARGIANIINKLTLTNEKAKTTFADFLQIMRNSINPALTKKQGLEMLAQHIITEPIFNALFKDYQFSLSNPISVAMNKVIQLLQIKEDWEHKKKLEKFYDETIKKIEGVDNAEGRQRIIIELYEKFFKRVFPKQTEQLGIVYTPIEIVDFIIRSVNDISQKEFGLLLNDKDVSILDPFTGTGTFISRLLESGLISKENLSYKYQKEIWVNEIVPLAYYFAAINIENIYHKLVGEEQYLPFQGICLTDTFRIGEEKGQLFLSQENSHRVQQQAQSSIKIILGNPPYSVGQKSENDDAKNIEYSVVDRRIKETYIKNSPKGLYKKSLYDSYFKAFRWSTDKLKDNDGIICFVSNGGWLDGISTVGFRNTIEQEFAKIYVFNLRGNKRRGNADFKNKQGEGIFFGVQIPISITLLVKKKNKADSEKAAIYYQDIGNYLDRKTKLATIKQIQTFANSSFSTILQPNEHGDWINQRKGFPKSFFQLAYPRKTENQNQFFSLQSLGISTARDAWVYNNSKNELTKNINKLIRNYNDDLNRYLNKDNQNMNLDSFVTNDPTKIKWDGKLKNFIRKKTTINFQKSSLFQGFYRPFFKQNLYFNKQLNNSTYQIPRFFPQPDSENLVICVQGKGELKRFSALITQFVPNYHSLSSSRCYPLYIYENSEKESQQKKFTHSDSNNRTDGITDFIFGKAKNLYQKPVTKEDLFYYVYGLFHSPEYKTTYHDTLQKENTQLPLLENEKHFWAFSKAGRELAKLHLNFENQPQPESVKVKIEEENFQITKMKFTDKKDKNKIIYNSFITISNIPPAAYEYQVNGQSAIEWVMSQQQIKTNKDSGIVNDPNKWAEEHNQPRYILDLLLSVITVSLETRKIVQNLPKVDFANS